MKGLEGFEARRIAAGNAEIFVRLKGEGPPLLLLHGFPQTHLCWTPIAGDLSNHFSVVLADLTGYGESRGPAAEQDGANYSKRAVAAQMTAMMEALGHRRFSIAGHDRGARASPIGWRWTISSASSGWPCFPSFPRSR